MALERRINFVLVRARLDGGIEADEDLYAVIQELVSIHEDNVLRFAGVLLR